MRHSVPSPPAAIVSCHLEQPLRDDVWERFATLQRRRPGGFNVIALMRLNYERVAARAGVEV